jgi:hypothetical protein
MPTLTDRAHQMSDLAEKLAREHALDFSLASLQKLEAIIAARSVDVETTRIWGAYLGETIRRQRRRSRAGSTTTRPPCRSRIARGFCSAR